MSSFTKLIIKGEEYSFIDPTKLTAPENSGVSGDILRLGVDGLPFWSTAEEAESLESKQFIQVRNNNTGAVLIDITEVPNTSVVSVSLLSNNMEAFIPLYSTKGITDITKFRVDDKLYLALVVSKSLSGWEVLNIYLTQYLALTNADISFSTLENGPEDSDSDDDSDSGGEGLQGTEVIYGVIAKNKIVHIDTLTDTMVIQGLNSNKFVRKELKNGEEHTFSNLEIGSWLVVLLPNNFKAELDYGGDNYGEFPVIPGIESTSLSANGETAIQIEEYTYNIYGMLNTVESAEFNVRIKEL